MSETEQAVTLEPCRWCGRDAKIEAFQIDDDPQWWYVATCVVCPVKTYDQFTAEEAARIWNTRASDVALQPSGEWRHVHIPAGNQRVVAIEFETAEKATEFINKFAAASTPVTAPVSTGEPCSNHFSDAALNKGFPDHIARDGTAHYRDGTVLPAAASTTPADPNAEFEYCPSCGGELDTGFECKKCRQDWRSYVVADEVQRRMDHVVETAVEWHKSDDHGWAEAADRHAAAIESLLELRDKPQTVNNAECFCGMELEAGLCPNGHDPVSAKPATPPPAVTEAGEQEQRLLTAEELADIERFQRQRRKNPVAADAWLYVAEVDRLLTHIRLEREQLENEIFQDATDPASTSSAAIRAAAEEIALNYEVHKNRCHSNERYPSPPCDCGAVDEVAAILSRWFGKGETESGESMNRVTFGSSATLAAPDNAACPKCGGTKPTCCSCPEQPANKFVQEFTQAAIEAHVGYQHEARWHECGYAKCVERREMIIALYDATPAAPSPGEPPPFRTTKEAMEWAQRNHVSAVIPVTADRCEHGISLDEECLTCENQQDEISVARTSVEGESE